MSIEQDAGRSMSNRCKYEILVGDKFGKWTVLESRVQIGGGPYGARVQCDCGAVHIAYNSNLKSGKSNGCKDCGNKISSIKRTRVALEGQRFGKLVVLNKRATQKGHSIYWLCLCDCGVEKEIAASNMLSGKSLSCGRCELPVGPAHPNWKGYGEISRRYWTGLLAGASARSLVVTISIEDAWNLFCAQNRRCALTDLPLCLQNPGKNGYGLATGSLDRVDSEQGYILGNVQWVHKDINRMKNHYTQEYFLYMCDLVSKRKNI